MDFSQAITTCFTKYADFTGRAKRSEYWWFALFCFVATAILHVLHLGLIRYVFSLAVFIPHIAVGARRLHDTNRTGWLLLLAFIPILGVIILIIWLAEDSKSGPNQYDGQV